MVFSQDAGSESVVLYSMARQHSMFAPTQRAGSLSSKVDDSVYGDSSHCGGKRRNVEELGRGGVAWVRH